MISNVNMQKIIKILPNYLLDKKNSFRKSDFPSISKPWDKKGTVIDVPDITVYEAMLRRSKFNASKVVSKCHEDNLTFSRMKTEVDEYAKSFMALGVKQGDVVPIYTQNINEAIIAFFALNKIGAVTTYLNASANQDEIERYLIKYNAKFVVMSSCFSDSASELTEKCNLDKIVVISPKDSINSGMNVSEFTNESYLKPATKEFNETDKVISLNSFKKIGKNLDLPFEYIAKKDDVSLICYTSGSTGEPKAIALTNENIIAELISLKKTSLMQLGPVGNSMQVVPFYYPYGFIISTLFPMFVGKITALTPGLTMDNLVSYLKLYKPNYISGIPPLYKSLLNNPEAKDMDLSFIKYPISGGDTYDINSKRETNEFLKKHGSSGKILDGSGNGEGGGSLTNPLALFAKYNPYSVGRPLKGLNVKITDPETGKELEYGKVGLFCFAGKNVAKEYYNDPENTKKVKYTDEDGIEWFHTDTLAHIDKKGWVYMDGRERRFFITYDEKGSPYKVYCDFVQSILNSVEEISSSIVVKRSDARRYYIPVAFIELKPGFSYTEELENKILEICKSNLQNCAIPLAFEVIDKVKYTQADKVDYMAYEKIIEDNDFQESKVR